MIIGVEGLAGLFGDFGIIQLEGIGHGQHDPHCGPGHVDAQMVLEKQRISVDRCDFAGKQMEGNMSGSILLNSNLADSRLDLKVAVKPLSDFLGDKGGGLLDVVKLLGQSFSKGTYKITIRGTFAQPQVNFT